MSSKLYHFFCLLCFLVLVPVIGLGAERDTSKRAENERLTTLFKEAGQEFQVPWRVLAAIALEETGLIAQPQDAESEGNPIVGVMGLRLNEGEGAHVNEVAQRLGVSPALLVASRRDNIRGAAAWLAQDVEAAGAKMVHWVASAGRFAGLQRGGSERYQANVAQRLIHGAIVGLRDGSSFVLPAVPDGELKQRMGSLLDLIPASPDYPSADYVPACTGNYTNASRGASQITRIVIHTVQGGYSSCYNWFANCDSNVSAHYVVSKTGQITQMVLDEDIAWHAGYSEYNATSIGIEHEGFVEEPDNYTDAMMQASAALTRSLALKYDIPMNQVDILGHVKVPGCSSGKGGGKSCHTDPGEYFDWNGYMDLVTNGDWVPGTDEGGGETVSPTTDAELIGFIREGDIYSGVNLAGAYVSLSSGEGDFTGTDGLYQFTGLEPGQVTVTAELVGYETIETSVFLGAGETTWNSMAMNLLPEEEPEGEEPAEEEEPEPEEEIGQDSEEVIEEGDEIPNSTEEVTEQDPKPTENSEEEEGFIVDQEGVANEEIPEGGPAANVPWASDQSGSSPVLTPAEESGCTQVSLWEPNSLWFVFGVLVILSRRRRSLNNRSRGRATQSL